MPIVEHHLRRRSLLTGLGACALLGPMAGSSRAALPVAPKRRFAGLFFNGGWDVLLGPDPRDPAGTYEGIDLGTSRLADAYRDPLPVTMAGQETLWGPTMAALVRHADIMTLFRGVNMNTVAHPAGRAYVNTFIPPAGVVPKGDSLGTRMAAAADYSDFILPNVAIGMASFNLSFEPAVTGVGLKHAREMTDLLGPVVSSPLSAETAELLHAAQDGAQGCVHPSYGPLPADQLAIARARVRQLIEDDYASVFDFAGDSALRSRYGIANPNVANDPAVVAATVSRLFESGLSCSVTAQLQFGLDSHGSEWATNHPERLVAGFNALAVLLDDLRQTDPNFEHTTVAVFSEFARTPAINGRGGRDHWFAGSILVFGGGLRRGVFGATVPDTLGLASIDWSSGLPDPNGKVVMPENIGATLAAAAGLSTTAFRAEPLTEWIL